MNIPASCFAPELAPENTPILVWVREADYIDRKRVGAWRLGKVARYPGLPDTLKADGYNGEWDIPYWTHLPPAPET